MAVAVNGSGLLFQASPPQPLFPVRTADSYLATQYYPSADGTRFLVNARVEDAAPRVLTVVLNWKVEGKK